MNATPLPCRRLTLDEMTRSLTVAATHGDIDLADERLVDGVLRQAGFDLLDIHALAEAAVDRARAALQALTSVLPPAADAAGLGLIIVVWVVAYVGICPA